MKECEEKAYGETLNGKKSKGGFAGDLTQAKDYIEKLLAQNKTLTEQKIALEEQLKKIVESKSWKITAPIRGALELIRKSRPLVRNNTYRYKTEVISALKERDKSDKMYELAGTSPSLSMISGSAVFPNGWCIVRSKVRSDQSHLASFLYYQTVEGFTSEERVLIESETQRVVEKLVRFPPVVQKLKIDPFDLKKPFNYELLEIKEIGSLQLLQHLFKLHIGKYLKDPQVLWHRLRKAFALFREGGLIALRVKLFADDITNNYQEWVKRFDTIDEHERARIRSFLEKQSYQPLISVLMPTYNTPERWLRAAIESVRNQLYQNWELCIADDASSSPRVREVIQEYAEQDKRIKFSFRSTNGHIVAASNSALELARGEFIGLLDHDDELTEDALAHVVAALNKDRDLDLIYSDEDKKTSHDMRFNPHFKSDWNPELLLSQNYICHFSVFRAKIVQELGGFRTGTEGAQDWDLIWRVADATSKERIRHIPHVLYHWRVIEGSTAQSTDFKPYVLEAQARTVRDHLERKGINDAEIEILRDISHLRVHFSLPSPRPLVSLIIPTKDKVEILKICVDSILAKSTYDNYEIIIVDNGSVEAKTHEYFDSLRSEHENIRIIEDKLPFNFSRINNDAVRHAQGSILGFLNNDLEVINPEWLSEMVSQAVRKENGAIGAQLWYPSQLLQHGGIILGIGGVAGHNHKGRRKGDPGYFNRIILPQNLSAVTAACLLMRREIFDQIGGFNEQDFSVAFNDVDLCLRVREAGYLVVYDPYAQLYHHESVSRGYENTPEKFLRFESEIENMKTTWKDALRSDPYYNPNLTLLSEDFAFSFPPRQLKPWNE